MNAEHEKARRHAYNTISEVNRHLDKGNVKKPQHHQMLTDMMEKATRTLNNLDAMDDRSPYKSTNIGYNADMRRGRRTNETVHDVMDAIDKILPKLAADYDDIEARRGVPGTGRGRRRGRRYAVADMDYDAAYDDDYHDDMRLEARRRGRSGRYVRSDMDDDMRTRDEHERHTHDAVARAAAATARHMMADMRGIYPGVPVMPRHEARDARDDVRHTARHDARDARSGDGEIPERTHRPGPDMRG